MSDLDQQVAALSSELTNLRMVLNQLGSYVFTKDVLGRYTFANDLVCQLFGVSLDQIVGKDDSHFFDLDASDGLRVNDRRVLDAGETIMREEENVVKPSGETRIYWTIKTPLRDDRNAIVGLCGISTDITERRRMENELRKQRLLVDTVLDNIDAYVYMKSSDRRFLYVNNRLARLIGQSPGDIVGRRDDEFFHNGKTNRTEALDREVFESKEVVKSEEILVDQCGQTRHLWAIRVPIALPEQPDAIVGLSSDITELHMLREELRRQTLTDPLTGVGNRRHLFDAAGQEFTRSQRDGSTLSVMIIDIDHFKRINDTYGHHAGDVAIRALARHCQETVRDGDLVGRLGGEEFAILLPKTGFDAATDMANRLCASWGETNLAEPGRCRATPTISVGIAATDGSDGNFETLLARADAALYRAKASGRNRVCVLAAA